MIALIGSFSFARRQVVKLLHLLFFLAEITDVSFLFQLDAEEDNEDKREDRDGYTETALPI